MVALLIKVFISTENQLMESKCKALPICHLVAGGMSEEMYLGVVYSILL